MKQISTELTQHIAGEVTTVATCWKLTRKDSTQMGFTDHDEDITVSSLLYKSATGFTPTAVSSSSGLNVDNIDIEGVLSSTAISKDDILAGIYDYAEVEIFQVNYKAPDDGKITLRTGSIGEITIKDGQFIAEIRGLTQQLNQNITKIYSRNCRAELGDSKCGVNMTSRMHSGSVTEVTSRRIFTDSSRTEDAGTFNFGVITFTSGANNGLSMEVKRQTAAGEITLMLPMPYDINASDTYSIKEGCDKRISTCSSKFSNAINFRGEPHVPGMDKILQTSSTRS